MYGEREIGDVIFNFESQFEDSGISCKHYGSFGSRISPTELCDKQDVAHEEDLMQQVAESQRFSGTSMRTAEITVCRIQRTASPPSTVTACLETQVVEEKIHIDCPRYGMFCSWWFASTSAPSPFTKTMSSPVTAVESRAEDLASWNGTEPTWRIYMRVSVSSQ